jgi:PEP-CTERM motif
MQKIPLLLSMIAGLTISVQPIFAGGIALQTPSGLHAGDTFRFVFVTDTVTTATNPNASYYDAIVNNEAISLGVTYQGQSLNWQAIVGTQDANAITHIGSSNHDQVYRVDGAKVATSTDTSPGGLWSGSLLNAINLDLAGNRPENPRSFLTGHVWTGTNQHGTPDTGNLPYNYWMGSTDGVSEGGIFYDPLFQYDPASQFWAAQNGSGQSLPESLYGISQELTVPGATSVPEPSTIALMGLGGIGLAIRFHLRRKAAVKNS